MLNFIIEKDGDKFHAYCKQLKGCHTFGETVPEAQKNLKDAVGLYLEDLLEEQLWNNNKNQEELCLS